MKSFIKSFFIFIFINTSVSAADVDLDQAFIDFTQSQIQTRFDNIASELSNMSAYRHNQSAAPQGLLGFSLGVSVSQAGIDNKADFAAAGYTEPDLYMPRLYVTKGLPFDIDLGATYSALPGTDISLLGFSLQYAILDGGLVMPAVSLRAGHNTLSGVDGFDLKSTTLEASISKGFLFFEPYASLGLVQNNAGLTVNEISSIDDNISINDYDKQESKLALGANFNFLLMQLGVQFDQIGNQNTTTANFGLHF